MLLSHIPDRLSHSASNPPCSNWYWMCNSIGSESNKAEVFLHISLGWRQWIVSCKSVLKGEEVVEDQGWDGWEGCNNFMQLRNWPQRHELPPATKSVLCWLHRFVFCRYISLSKMFCCKTRDSDKNSEWKQSKTTFCPCDEAWVFLHSGQTVSMELGCSKGNLADPETRQSSFSECICAALYLNTNMCSWMHAKLELSSRKHLIWHHMNNVFCDVTAVIRVSINISRVMTRQPSPICWSTLISSWIRSYRTEHRRGLKRTKRRCLVLWQIASPKGFVTAKNAPQHLCVWTQLWKSQILLFATNIVHSFRILLHTWPTLQILSCETWNNYVRWLTSNSIWRFCHEYSLIGSELKSFSDNARSVFGNLLAEDEKKNKRRHYVWLFPIPSGLICVLEHCILRNKSLATVRAALSWTWEPGSLDRASWGNLTSLSLRKQSQKMRRNAEIFIAFVDNEEQRICKL